jgi:hypothetical protein
MMLRKWMYVIVRDNPLGEDMMDMSTLAETPRLCEERRKISETSCTSEWLARHPFKAVRRVLIEAVPEVQ